MLTSYFKPKCIYFYGVCEQASLSCNELPQCLIVGIGMEMLCFSDRKEFNDCLLHSRERKGGIIQISVLLVSPRSVR